MTKLLQAINERNYSKALELLQTEKGERMAKETDENGDLPLHRALACRLYYDPTSLIEKLIDVYPKGLKLKNRHGSLPVHIAAMKVQVGPLQLLHSKYPAGLQKEDNHGNLPIHCLARVSSSSNSISLEYLISKYPGGLKHKNNDGDLPIHLSNDASFLQLATACPETLSIKDRLGRVPVVVWLCSRKLAGFRAEIVGKVMTGMVSQTQQDKKAHQEEIANVKNSLASVTKDLEYEKKMSTEARKIEKEFRAQLLDPENEAAASIDTLKSFAVSLKTRLDLTKAKQQQANALDDDSDNTGSKYKELMFSSFIKDPDVSRSAIVDCIEMLDAELSSLEEEQGQQNAEETNEEDSTAAVAESGNDDDSAGVDDTQVAVATTTMDETINSETADPSSRANKRPRVSIS